jgi:hypothetical protein
MRSRLLSLVLGAGLVAATAAPSFACAYHDQQAAAQSQQQTAQAQQTGTTSTQ